MRKTVGAPGWGAGSARHVSPVQNGSAHAHATVGVLYAASVGYASHASSSAGLGAPRRRVAASERAARCGGWDGSMRTTAA